MTDPYFNFNIFIFPGNVSTVVAVVCVGFIIVFVALGIIRFRAAQKRSARDDLQAEIEMAWDDSALNITVNPLEVGFDLRLSV